MNPRAETPRGAARSGGGGAAIYVPLGFAALLAAFIFLLPPTPTATLWGLGGLWAVVFIGFGVYFMRMRRQAAAERELFERGSKAMAVVERVETTGVVLNGVNQQIVLRLRVRQRDGAEFSHERRLFVPIHALPRTGDVIEVAYDPADPTRVALATDWHGGTSGGRRLMLRPGGGTEAGANGDVVQQLERLDRLRQSGSLTFTEFEALKARILSGRDV